MQILFRLPVRQRPKQWSNVCHFQRNRYTREWCFAVLRYGLCLKRRASMFLCFSPQFVPCKVFVSMRLAVCSSHVTRRVRHGLRSQPRADFKFSFLPHRRVLCLTQVLSCRSINESFLRYLPKAFYDPSVLSRLRFLWKSVSRFAVLRLLVVMPKAKVFQLDQVTAQVILPSVVIVAGECQLLSSLRVQLWSST